MKLGIIGVGKIASAVVEGLCTSSIENLTIFLSPRNEQNARKLSDKYTQITRLSSNQEVLDRSDFLIIALPTATVKGILESLRFEARHRVISVVALLKYDDLAPRVQPAQTICRAIPLPSVMYHNCPIPLYRADEDVQRLFSHLGHTLIVEEEGELHALWTLTGLITPFYHLLEELSQWTIQQGVKKPVANQYIADLYQSLAYLAQQVDPIDFSELAQHAATPNGMNEQAGKEISEKGGHQLYAEASDRLLKRFE